MALVVTREGYPLGYEVFAGNRTDVTTVEEVVTTMEGRYGRADRIWAMDRGMVSEEKVAWLKAGGRRYLLGTPKSMLRRFERPLLEGPWETVREGLEVQRCPSPDGAETFILCRSRARQEKERAIHERFERRIEKGLSEIEEGCWRRRQDLVTVAKRVGRLLGQNTRAAGLFRTDVVAEAEGRARLVWSKVQGWRRWATLSGVRVAMWAAGTWKGKTKYADGKEEPREGFFRANLRTGAYESAAAKDTRPWMAQAKDFKSPGPGEHPRLFFRKADLPELKRRAETPDGKKILARLRQLLNGSNGESMPTLLNPAKQAYEKNNFKAKPGAYSISHAAGFGFLYQLTGEKKHADLARQCVEKAWAGQRDFDDRYSWVAPGGELRAGPSVGWYAVAYDLCYDAWDDAFRRKVALAIQNYDGQGGGEWNKNEDITLGKMVLTPKQGPGSNHFGAVVGGCGLAVLAIKGDPGADNALLDKYATALERQVVRHLSAGWGDGGYYKEGWGASTVGTQAGFLCFLQALKTAAGHDYLNVDRPSASYVTMVPRCLMLIGPPAVLPYRSNMGGTYGSAEFYKERTGFSHGGHFSEGFGAVADRYKPALLWTYNHVVEPEAGNRDFDTPSLYPHRPMLALINWPTFQGVEEKNPAEAMPLTSADHLYDYYVFRNRWQDKDDIVTTVLLRPPDGTKPRDIMVWGLGLRLTLGEPDCGAPVTHYQAAADGSGVLAAGKFALAVDYSKASGAEALAVTVGGSAPKPDPKAGEKAKVQPVTAGGTTFNVMTLSADGRHPEVKAEGGGLTIGKQTVKFADGKLVLGVFAPAPAYGFPPSKT